MNKTISFFLPLFICTCVGEESLQVGSHEEALTHTYNGTSGSDRICLHSTNNGAQGLHRWICGSDRVPTDITDFDYIVVNLGKGDDTLVVKGSAPNGACSCSCNVNGSIYGSAVDYVYPNTFPWHLTINDTPISNTSASGNDKIFLSGGGLGGWAEGQVNRIWLYSGSNTVRGGGTIDVVHGAAAENNNHGWGPDFIWDPGNGGLVETNHLHGGSGTDTIVDLSCTSVDISTACDCYTPGNDNTIDCAQLPNCGSVNNDCENIIPTPAAPACPALPFP